MNARCKIAAHRAGMSIKNVVPELAGSSTSGQVPRICCKRNKITELGRQSSHIRWAEGDQKQEPAATIMLDPLDKISDRKDTYW